MPGAHSSLRSLEIRRSLLTAEAEIRREQIFQEWAEFKNSFREIEGAIKSTRSVFSVVSAVSAGASAFLRLRGGRGGLVPKILAGASLVSALWFALRPRSK